MITVDDVIAFGYFRKWYHEMVKHQNDINAYPKDYINKVVAFTGDETRRQSMLEENKQTQKESEDYSRSVIQISVDKFNELGYNIEDIKEKYKN